MILPTKASGSYSQDDVTFLVKLLETKELSVTEKEKTLQSGNKHYSEIIAIEYVPEASYMNIFQHLLRKNSKKMAKGIVALANHMDKSISGEITLISLMRAGTPVGVLLKRVLEQRFGRNVKHYSISIVRDRGIDENALNYILDVDKRNENNCVFIDGWTAKGVITRELKKYVSLYNKKFSKSLRDKLYVLSDIGGTADVTASYDDYPIPSGVLNGTISGLLSRSILNDEIGEHDFHGAKYFKELECSDFSLKFVDEIMNHCMSCDVEKASEDKPVAAHRHQEMITYINKIMDEYDENDINMVKPGIAEATRVMLRRVPEVLILKDADDKDTSHLVELARSKNVLIKVDPSMPFKAVSLIARMTGND